MSLENVLQSKGFLAHVFFSIIL